MKWQRTQFPGVRYREHPTRRHNGRPDRYFTIRLKQNNKLVEEALGWASDGWNAEKAMLTRNDLVKAYKLGEGPTTLAEKREIRQKERKEDEKRKSSQITFGTFFEKTYYPQAQSSVGDKSYKREEQLFRLWIKPVIGDLAFPKITVAHLNEIKENLLKVKRSARTTRYMLAVVRQVFNYARFTGFYSGTSPVQNVKFPHADNKRRRFLTPEEVRALLKNLRGRSEQLYEMALISVETGARADEIFSLQWKDVDLTSGHLTLWDTKNKRTRVGFMTAAVRDLLKRKTAGEKTDYVFPARGGGKIGAISNAFREAVNELRYNEGVSDPRMKVVFHTLRHTYASWLVQAGENIYTVQKLMGHSTLQMTERYSHLGKGTLQEAVRHMDTISLDLDEGEGEPLAYPLTTA